MSVNKNISIKVATSPGLLIVVAGRTDQKATGPSTKQRKQHTSGTAGRTRCRTAADQRAGAGGAVGTFGYP